MRVDYTPEAYANLDAILSRLFDENSVAARALAAAIDDAVSRVAQFPKSAPVVAFGSNVRVVNLHRYPYRIFYRVRPDAVEILHIRHASRAPWSGGR